MNKINYLFSGTLVNNGSAIAVVINTGMFTEIGRIQSEVTEAQEDKEEDSPLKKKINEFGDQLAKYITYM